MDVPPAPLWQFLLLEQPFLVAVALLVVAVVLRTLGRRSGHAWLGRSAAVTLLVGLGVIALGYAVETGREAIDRRTRELVDAAAPVDAAAVRDLLHADVVVTGPQGGMIFEGDEVRRRIEASDERYEFVSHRVRSLTAWASGDEGRVELGLFSEGVTPTLTRWGLFWERRGEGPWRLTEVRLLRLNGMDPPVGALR